MEKVTIFHNPRCSKSRSALELLRARGIEPVIVEYLKTPPTRAELEELLRKLRMRAEDVVRKSEETYKTRYAQKTLNDVQWLDALVAHPVLLERPIVVKGESAVMGRPPENVLQLL